MHIVFIITRGDAVGGATVHVRDLARRLIERGERATVLVGGQGAAREELERSGIPCRRIRTLRRAIVPWQDVAAVGEIALALSQLRPDLVSTHTAKAGWVGRLAARLAGVPAIFTPHGWAIAERISPLSGRVFRVAERCAAPLAETIVNVCEAEKRLAERHRIAPSRKLAVIHNGVRDVPPALRAKPELSPPQITMVARFEPPKDHGVFLEALAKIRNLPWQAEFIGEGPGETTARRLAARLGIGARVHFAGASVNIAERLSRAQIFALTSNSEGFPRSVLEAMRAGLPVLASRVGGIPEAVEHWTTGFVVPRGDQDPIAEALAILIENPHLRARMGRAGRRRYEAHFTFDRMAEKTLDLYQRTVRKTMSAHATRRGV